MATNFKLKRSSVANKRPGLSNLELGELALNTYDGFLFTERNGLGITTVTNLTPWYENYGAGSIFYTNKVGIGTTTVPDTNQLLVKGGTETDRLNVTGVSTFLDDVTFTGANYNVAWDRSDNSLKFVDDAKAKFGTGGDLEIFHDGNFSYIKDTGTGDLVLQGTNNVWLGHTNSEYGVKVTQNAGVELRFDNIKKFETTISGISVTGTTDTDNFINAGVSTFVGIITASATQNVIPFLYSAFSDLPSATSYHGAFAHVHARGKGYFAHAANWYELVNKELDGTIGVGTEQVRVGVTTVTDFNATGNVTLGDADTDNIVFNGDINSNIIPNTNITYELGSAAKRWKTLYTGGSTKIDSDIVTRNLSVTGLGTFANDVTFTTANSNNVVLDQSDNSLDFGDGVVANFGTDEDLFIRHTGNDATIKNNTGNFYIVGGGSGTILQSNLINFKNFNNNETYATFTQNASVDLYYDNVKKFSTSGVGVTVYNQLDTTNINASGIITAVDGNFTGNVSIAGTLTYQDVTNVDSVGIATARVGLDVLSGGINAVGIVTADGLDAIGIQSGGVNITTGIITAINFTGTGNTVTYDSSTKIVSVSVGGAGGGTGGKFVANNTGIHTLSNVGIGTTNASDKLKVLGDVAFTGALKVSPLGLSGSNGNYLKSVGSGVTWAAFPTARTVGLQTATANQTSFSFTYNVGFLDVYINGVKLTTNEFTATNGTSVVLTEGAFVGDQVQLISFNTTASGGGGGSGISEVVQDTTPQLGGNLDLNSKIINGSGNIDYTGNFKASGIATATTFVGDLTGDVTGTATEATNVTVSANNTTNETVYPVFVDGATGTQGAETDTGLTYNPNTGNLTATKFSGDGSSITGISTSNITNYGVGLGGGGGSIAGIDTTGTSFFNNINAAGVTTFSSNVNISGTNRLELGSDFDLYRSSGNTLVSNQTGDLLIDNNASGGDVKIYSNTDFEVFTSDTKDAIKAVKDDAVKLYFNGNQKLTTTNTGAVVSGILTATSFSGTVPSSSLSGALPALDGSALTGIAVTEAPVTDYTITANGNSAYRFAGGGVNSSSDNPDLYLVRGQKYRFNNTTGTGHPFEFRNSADNADYTSGISGSQSGIQFFTVPLDAPAAIKYRCTIHTSDMVGDIYIRGASSAVTLSNNADNRVITGGSGAALNGEANLTFDGTNLKIGNAGTDGVLRIRGAANSTQVSISDNTSATLRIKTASGALGQIFVESGQNLVLGTDNTERFRIDSSGSIMTTGNVNIGRSSNAGEALTVRGPADGDAIRLERAGSYQWFMGQDSGSNLYFKANTTKEITFPAAGGIAFNGETASNNTLNDYEEGTHTTTVTISGNTSFSYSSRALAYTKIGRVVHLIGRINLTNAGGGSTFDFTLPFTCGDGGTNYQYETSNEFQVIRGNDTRTFRIREGESVARCQNDGSNGDIGVGNPHINVFLTYFTN